VEAWPNKTLASAEAEAADTTKRMNKKVSKYVQLIFILILMVLKNGSIFTFFQKNLLLVNSSEGHFINKSFCQSAPALRGSEWL
jgi:hypothetical protein